MHTNLRTLGGFDDPAPLAAAMWQYKYAQAKTHYDMGAAFDVVDRCINDDVIGLLVDSLCRANKPAMLVIPQPGFHDDGPCEPVTDTPTNALPFAFAQRISESLECDIADNIIQVSQPGRTKLKKFPRFLWQPRFEGDVRHDRAYILVDDVCTNGGTLAMLRTHIVANGGTVIAATTLAHKSGVNQIFPIERATQGVLSSVYGSGLAALWNQEVGHDIECLTQGEGTGLVEWTRENVTTRDASLALQRLRNRLVKARRTAS